MNFEFSQPAPEEPSPFTPLVYSPRRLALRSELQDILAKLDERRCRCVASDATDDSRDATSNGYSSSIRNRFARTREGDGGCRGVEDKSSTLTAQETSSLVSSPERGSGGDVPRFFCVLAAGARPLLSLHFLSVHEDSLPLTARKTVSLLAVVAARAAASAAHRLGKFASLKLRKSPKPSSSNADTERESATDALSDCNERASKSHARTTDDREVECTDQPSSHFSNGELVEFTNVRACSFHSGAARGMGRRGSVGDATGAVSLESKTRCRERQPCTRKSAEPP